MAKAIATPSRTREIIDTYQLSLKKSLGQNFIHDVNILQKFVEATEASENDGVIEVGPGIGALTEQLAKRAKKVVAYEIDQRLLPVLSDTLARYSNVEIRHQDFLKADLSSLFKTAFTDTENVVAAGNLPYYVTTPILMRFLESRIPIKTLTVMIQKEVGERLAAVPGTKAYGSLSIATQYYAEAKTVARVPASVFIPRPNVDSVIIRFRIRKKPAVYVQDERFFFSVVRAAFSQRRKTIANNLLHWLQDTSKKAQVQHVFSEAEIDPQRRAETLSISEFATLSSLMLRHGISPFK